MRSAVGGGSGRSERGRPSLYGREDGVRPEASDRLRRKVQKGLEAADFAAAAAAPRDVGAVAAAAHHVAVGSTDCWAPDHPAGRRDRRAPA